MPEASEVIEGPHTLNVSGPSVWDSLPVFTQQEETPKPPAEERPSEEQKPPGEEKKPDAPVDTKPPEQKPEQAPDLSNLSPKARDNFKRIEERAKAAEVRAKELADKAVEFEKRQAEYEARIKEAEERASKVQPVDLTPYQKRQQELEEQLQRTRQELQFKDMERDPAFLSRFDTSHLTGKLEELASTQGIDKVEFERLIRMGDGEKLRDIRDGLPFLQQQEYDAAFLQIRQTNFQKEQALKQRDTTLQEWNQQRQKQWQEQQSLQIQKNLSLADEVISQPLQQFPDLPPEVQEEITASVRAIAGGDGSDKWDMKTTLQRFAALPVAIHISRMQKQVIEEQTGEIETLKKKLEEVEKTLAEKDQFIQGKYGSMPRNGSTGPSVTSDAPRKAVWEDL